MRNWKEKVGVDVGGWSNESLVRVQKQKLDALKISAIIVCMSWMRPSAPLDPLFSIPHVRVQLGNSLRISMRKDFPT